MKTFVTYKVNFAGAGVKCLNFVTKDNGSMETGASLFGGYWGGSSLPPTTNEGSFRKAKLFVLQGKYFLPTDLLT